MSKVLKVKVGTVYIDGKTHDVFNDAWEKESKNGQKYYVMSNPIFVQDVTPKPVPEKTVNPTEL